jgi:hypothetical protein
MKMINKTVTITGRDSSVASEITELALHHEYKLRSVKTDEERDMLKMLISILKKRMISVVVGGNTISSITERKDRADDCINSVELALLGGVVPGGGAAYTGMGSGCGCSTDIESAVEKVSLLINGGNSSGSNQKTLDPTIVATIVAEQAIELAFTLGMTKSVVLSN